MARNMVTRTVHGTQVAVKVVDKETEQIVEDKIVLSKAFSADDTDKLKKAVTKALSEDKILVSIVSTTAVDKCYGVPVSFFMEHATELDPKTRSAQTEEAKDAVTE